MKVKRVENRIDSGDTTLATVLSLLSKAIDKLLPTNLVDLPHERFRVLKELLHETQFDVSGAGQISVLLRISRTRARKKQINCCGKTQGHFPRKLTNCGEPSKATTTLSANKKKYWSTPLIPPSKEQNW